MKISKQRASFFLPTCNFTNFRNQVEACKKTTVEVNEKPFEILKLDPESEMFQFHQDVLGRLKGKKTYPFFEKMFELVDDPERFLAYLKPLDEALGCKMQEEGLQIGDDIIPQQILLGLNDDFFFPPLPPELDLDQKKNRILSRTIAERKLQRGQSADDVAFLRLVDQRLANAFVKDGNLFSDKTTLDRDKHTLVLHNKHTHQIFFDALNLIYNEFFLESCAFSMEDILDDLISDTGEKSLWNLLLDNVVEKKLNVDKPEISASNPFFFNSMIMLFGTEFGLPNLQKCLLDSFYKDMAKIWHDYKQDPGADDRKAIEFPEFYLAFFLYGNQAELQNSFKDFTPKFRDEKYQPFADGKYGDDVVVRKEGAKASSEEYTYQSFEDYASQNYLRDSAKAEKEPESSAELFVTKRLVLDGKVMLVTEV